MKCVIIAAGQGSRMQPRWVSKPLVPLLGIPLIQRVMQSAYLGGAGAFVVVTGYEGARVRACVDAFSEQNGTDVTHVVNPAWTQANGVSVLCARDVVREPFLLLMADHLFDPRIVRDLLAQPVADGEVMLAVDYDTANPLVDLSDVTRVRVDQTVIRRMGKGLDPYDAFDTGIFYGTPGLFDAIERSIARGDASLTGGMNVLAAEGRARAFDVRGRFWLDVDEPRDVDRAEHLLATELVAA